LGDKILATGKHWHFDSNLHLHAPSAILQEVADPGKKHWEHVSGCWAGVDDVEFGKGTA